MPTPGASTSTHRNADGDETQGPRRKLLPVVIGYVIAILIGLVLPRVAVALYFGIAVYLIVPFREVARLLFTAPIAQCRLA